MLTRISAVTGAIIAIVNFIVLMGWLDWSTDQVTGFTILVGVLGASVHSWFNPNVKIPGSVKG